jgi:hypothetical protein
LKFIGCAVLDSLEKHSDKLAALPIFGIYLHETIVMLYLFESNTFALHVCQPVHYYIMIPLQINPAQVHTPSEIALGLIAELLIQKTTI